LSEPKETKQNVSKGKNKTWERKRMMHYYKQTKSMDTVTKRSFRFWTKKTQKDLVQIVRPVGKKENTSLLILHNIKQLECLFFGNC
jgi:hypothetical protein